MRRLIFSSLLFAVCGISVVAQDQNPSRTITSEGFRSQRPSASDAGGSGQKAAAGALSVSKKNSDVISNPKRKYSFVSRSSSRQASTVAIKPAAAPTYKPAAPQTKVLSPELKAEELGVTFWRLRPLKDTDGDVPTFPVRVGDGTQNWVAERVKSSTKFKPGDRVRFTIEASRTGYMYIVNRELYADGTSGDAEIIFPTLRTRSGDNHVSAGTLVEIPGSNDSVPYFTIQPRRADYVGEELIVVITPKEMTDFEKTLRPQPISVEKLGEWYAWQMGADVYDAEDGEGIAYTQTEAIAAENTSRSLTREDPLPQTIYRLKIPKEMPLFVIVRMEAGKQ